MKTCPFDDLLCLPFSEHAGFRGTFLIASIQLSFFGGRLERHQRLQCYNTKLHMPRAEQEPAGCRDSPKGVVLTKLALTTFPDPNFSLSFSKSHLTTPLELECGTTLPYLLS